MITAPGSAAEHGGDEFGTALISGDLNGDGVEDLMASAVVPESKFSLLKRYT